MINSTNEVMYHSYKFGHEACSLQTGTCPKGNKEKGIATRELTLDDEGDLIDLKASRV